MHILGESEKLLENIGLGTGQSLQIAGRKVSRYFLRWGVIFTLVLFIIMESLVCIGYFTTNLPAALWTFCLAFLYFFALIIYVCLITKASEINELFDCLKSVINKSK